MKVRPQKLEAIWKDRITHIILISLVNEDTFSSLALLPTLILTKMEFFKDSFRRAHSALAGPPLTNLSQKHILPGEIFTFLWSSISLDLFSSCVWAYVMFTFALLNRSNAAAVCGFAVFTISAYLFAVFAPYSHLIFTFLFYKGGASSPLDPPLRGASPPCTPQYMTLVPYKTKTFLIYIRFSLIQTSRWKTGLYWALPHPSSHLISKTEKIRPLICFANRPDLMSGGGGGAKAPPPPHPLPLKAKAKRRLPPLKGR